MVEFLIKGKLKKKKKKRIKSLDDMIFSRNFRKVKIPCDFSISIPWRYVERRKERFIIKLQQRFLENEIIFK